MYCKHCGQKADLGSNFCTNCGTKLGTTESNNNSLPNVNSATDLEPKIIVNKPTQNTRMWLMVWVGFHLFALLIAYTGVDLFNNGGRPETDKFWPFDDFIGKHYHSNETYFRGIFVNYDWSEFAFYVGSVLFIYYFSKFFPSSSEPEDPVRAGQREELTKQFHRTKGSQ